MGRLMGSLGPNDPNKPGKWSWGRISWDRNCNFSWDRNYDHEVKIVFVREVEFVQWYWSGGWHFDHKIKTQKNIISNFDLMINLLVASTIMRSKFKINYLNLVSCTCGKFLALIITHLCIRTFDLMNALAANKSITRSKFPNYAFF